MQYEFDFASVLANWPQFLEGAWMTILLSFPATVIGLWVARCWPWGGAATRAGWPMPAVRM
jgi:ABC-type amino acid transport system permease subunit